MKKNNITVAVNRAIYQTRFQLKKHSPEILLAAGVIGAVVSAVMACKATTKLNGILDETKENLDAVHKAAEDESLKEKYSEEDATKDTAIIYIQTGVKLAKLYGPAAVLGALSVANLIMSHKIMTKRCMEITTAYNTLYASYKQYRHRVVERFGERVDRELRYNIKAREIEETVIDEEGKETKVKKPVDVAGPLGYSEYARFFDESSHCWEKNGEYNLMFLRSQQQLANDKLRSRGYLFLSEVYEALGIQEDPASHVVGWVYDRGRDPEGDNYVDFGIQQLGRVEDLNDLDEEPERTILLDFNVDGCILEKFPKFDITH